MASLPTTQRAWTIGQLPTGPITADTFKLTTTNLPELADNQVLLRVEYFSNDPVVRQRILALSPGDIVGCWAVASVLASKAPQWVQGDRVFGELGWYDVGVVDASKIKSRAAELPNRPYASLSPLGISSLTAHQAILDVLKPSKGQTVLVSAAAGSVGSAAVQMAKINGAHVVGIAGGPDKCRWVVETLGADACVDYKAADFAEKLKAALPNGADRYLDMVGGVVFDTALRNMAFKGEIGTIGAVSTYNGHAVPFHNMLEFPLRRLTMHGFTVFDYYDKAPAVYKQIVQWINSGKYNADGEMIVKTGIEGVPATWNSLFSGANKGKLITQLQV